MKVADWVGPEFIEQFKPEESVSTFGGFFSDGMRWKDYITIWKDELVPYIEAIREAVLVQNLQFGGDEHQYGEYGTPLFEDGTIGSFSFRAWGDLMAAIWAEKEDKDYSYMDFYMSCLIKEK